MNVFKRMSELQKEYRRLYGISPLYGVNDSYVLLRSDGLDKLSRDTGIEIKITERRGYEHPYEGTLRCWGTEFKTLYKEKPDIKKASDGLPPDQDAEKF